MEVARPAVPAYTGPLTPRQLSLLHQQQPTRFHDLFSRQARRQPVPQQSRPSEPKTPPPGGAGRPGLETRDWNTPHNLLHAMVHSRFHTLPHPKVGTDRYLDRVLRGEGLVPLWVQKASSQRQWRTRASAFLNLWTSGTPSSGFRSPLLQRVSTWRFSTGPRHCRLSARTTVTRCPFPLPDLA